MRLIFDLIIACLAITLVWIALYLAIFAWSNAARAALPKACDAYRSECTAVMQDQF